MLARSALTRASSSAALLTQDRLVPRVLERRAKTVAHERRVVGDDDGLRGDRGAGHVRYNPTLIAIASAGRILARHRSNCQTERDAHAPRSRMATCPECDAEIEVDEFDVDKGDQLSCPECGSNLEVTGLSPLELDLAPDDDDEDDEDDEDEDEDDDDSTRTKTTRTTKTRTTTRRRRLGRMIEKERALRETLSSLGSVIVAYSGGVDSAYLAYVAHDTLGSARAGRHRRQPELSRTPPPDGRADRRALRPAPRDHPDRTSSSGPSTAPIPPTAATSASTSSTRTWRASPPSATPSSSTATTPTTAATIGRAARPRASSASAARSTKSISRRTRSASCRGARGCRPGTSRRRRACRRAFRITPK